MSKTFNRGQLLRLAKAGKLVSVDSYHFDDMLGESRNSEPTQVHVKANHDDRVEGACNLMEWDFKSSSGSAWLNPNGTITLRVHSNCNFTFRRV